MMVALEPRRLGRYEILRPLARGGMAELFLARATGISGFEKLVVVKRILPELAGAAEYVGMFLEEARLAAGLHHSNIVQVYDIGEADGTPFFAMEYLQGHDVRALVRAAQADGRRMPLEHALSIAIGVTAALHYAHEQRDADGKPLALVHRDVSPHNIAVTFDGGVKLLDFGVAKTRRQKSATRHGTLKGKVGYMSPEQCRGDELDRRSDVFAAAIVLWELVTGRRLYGGRSDFGVMKSIAEADAPRPSLLWPDCPPELEAIVMRGLVRERHGRWQTAQELQLALEAFARERRLAVSGVGLGRWVRERVGAPAEAGAGEVTTSLYDAAAPDEDDGAPTVVDGALAPEPGARRTRAVARRRTRSPRLWLAPVLLALGALGAWRLTTLRHAPPAVPRPAAASANAPAARPAPPPSAPSGELPTVDVPSPSASEPARPRAAVSSPPRAHKRPRPSHRSPSPSPLAPPSPTHVDLDAPLPPR